MPRVETRGSENEEESMQNDEVMCQTIQGLAGYRNPFNHRTMYQNLGRSSVL